MESPKIGIALCALGLEKVCGHELERLGLEVADRSPGRLRFVLHDGPKGEARARAAAPPALLYRANLRLRTAERVLVEAGSFEAADFDRLYEGVRSLPWELYFARTDKLVIERVRLRDSALAAQTAVQSIVHKALYDRLGAVFRLGRLPETGNVRSLRVYVDRDRVTLGLDCSGEALHKRGYRRAPGQAPLKETVAAGALLLSGWSRRLPLLDPFCGAGTILVEAAMFAQDRAPGLGRRFAMEDMPFVDRRALESESEDAAARMRRDVDFVITGGDADEGAIAAARANLDRAGLLDRVELRVAKAEDAVPGLARGYLLCNPPYGERLGTPEEAEGLYRRLGRACSRFGGWGLGFVTNRPDFGDFFGSYALSAHRIVNGAEEQWFHWYPPGEERREGRRPRPRDRGAGRREPGTRRGGGEGPSRPSGRL